MFPVSRHADLLNLLFGALPVLPAFHKIAVPSSSQSFSYRFILWLIGENLLRRPRVLGKHLPLFPSTLNFFFFQIYRRICFVNSVIVYVFREEYARVSRPNVFLIHDTDWETGF